MIMSGWKDATRWLIPQLAKARVLAPRNISARRRRRQGSIARFGEPGRRSIAVDLQPGDAQACDPVGFDCALPSEKFFHREFVTAANFLESNGAAAHRIYNHSLAPGDPALGLGRR